MTLLMGAKAIGKYLSPDSQPLSERQARYLIQRGGVPVFRIGSTICSTPELIDQHFRNLAIGGNQ